MNQPLIRLINVLVPGAGLIVLRREWLGTALGLLFCLLAQISLLGWLIIPAEVPAWVIRSSAVAAALVWGGSQWLLLCRLKVAVGPAVDREIESLCARINDALARQDLEDADALVRAGLKIDDENVALNRFRADVAARVPHSSPQAKGGGRTI